MQKIREDVQNIKVGLLKRCEYRASKLAAEIVDLEN